MSPKRIQMSRQHPWRATNPDAVIVARPSKWGNPFKVYRCQCCGYWDVMDENGVTYLIDHERAKRQSIRPDASYNHRDAAAHAVGLFRALYGGGSFMPERDPSTAAELTGRDLACWCPLDQPCHADVLLALANEAGS